MDSSIKCNYLISSNFCAKISFGFSYPKDYYLSIFNYEPIKKTDSLVDKINSDTKLKVINIDIPSNHSDIFSLLTVFYKTENNSAEKIIHQEFNKYYELTTTYYLVNETPIYIEQNYDIKSAPDRPAQNAFYIQNWNMNKYVLKKKNLGGRKFEKEKWEKIIELSNSKVSNIMGNH